MPSKKNEYSSFFAGKNLIFVVAESYSEISVSEELTPTLYKLTHSGFVFNNFYVPYYLSTIGGEFQSLTGLFPDSSILPTWRNGTTYFPYGLSVMFKEKGYNTYAYHDNSGYFQDRNKYLKSIGFDNFKACYMGLDIDCDIWPESDIEIIDKTYSDYMDSYKPFLAYYMTVSGHFEYTFDVAEAEHHINIGCLSQLIRIANRCKIMNQLIKQLLVIRFCIRQLRADITGDIKLLRREIANRVNCLQLTVLLHDVIAVQIAVN